MKKSISAVLVLLLLTLNISAILANNLRPSPTSNAQQTISMSNSQLQNIEGGLPAVDCALLLTTCMVGGGSELGWVGLLICASLAAYCLTA